MGQYLDTLRTKDFRRLWLGATVSTLGDGMTYVALAWLVAARPGGTAQLGLLGVCYTAPVLVGGWAVGPLLDRFDKRTVLVADSVVRALAVASVPVAAALAAVPGWLPFAVAAVYGALKMVPLAGFPASIPYLVDDSHLEAANALESFGFSVAGVVGPAAAGLLVGWIGAPNVLLADSVSFLVFASAAALVRPLRPRRDPARPYGSLRVLARDRVIVTTTLAFMAFNVAEGMLLVTAPWLAVHRLGGATALGVLLALLAAGELVGAAVAGHRRPSHRRVLGIGIVQAAGALGFLAVLAGAPPLVGAGFLAVGGFGAAMTVWAQALRMRRIPAELHGRAFALLRTLMQATPPLGAVLVTPLLVHAQQGAAALVMATVAGVPAMLLVAAGRRTRTD
ncbi:MFS transporter [Actinocatenispora rupis]|uniref:MFS transporter n=1 Tax=Actinocatenispora rupis TaxID=519421 RepID=A0A8J3JBU3_9ACTN|nr:MFS transporter [Actinocatenispora rupis]GID15535.1 MFS transporter [Actinocatenispora rupis]